MSNPIVCIYTRGVNGLGLSEFVRISWVLAGRAALYPPCPARVPAIWALGLLLARWASTVGWGKTPLPPFTEKNFSEKGVADLGGTPMARKNLEAAPRIIFAFFQFFVVSPFSHHFCRFSPLWMFFRRFSSLFTVFNRFSRYIYPSSSSFYRFHFRHELCRIYSFFCLVLMKTFMQILRILCKYCADFCTKKCSVEAPIWSAPLQTNPNADGFGVKPNLFLKMLNFWTP